MKVNDPFGFVKAIQVPKDKKMIDKVHKILKKKIQKTTGFGDLGHYEWEKPKKLTKKQIRESGWD